MLPNRERFLRASNPSDRRKRLRILRLACSVTMLVGVLSGSSLQTAHAQEFQPPNECQVPVDHSGYRCLLTEFSWLEGTAPEVIEFNDTAVDAVSDPISLPFTFNWYGRDYNEIHVGSMGLVCFQATGCDQNDPGIHPPPSTQGVDNLIGCLWTDQWDMWGTALMTYAVVGEAPNQSMVITFSGVSSEMGDGAYEYQFQIQENGDAACSYRDMSGTLAPVWGIGTENFDGSDGLRWVYLNGNMDAELLEGRRVLFDRILEPTPRPGIDPFTVKPICSGTTCTPGTVVDPCEPAQSGPGADQCSIRTVSATSGPDSVNMVATPLNQVIVVSANVNQRNARPNQVCPPKSTEATNTDYKNFKSCDQAKREQRFGKRMRDLAVKDLEEDIDGMGHAPDVILLQEAARIDAQGIRDALNERFAYSRTVLVPPMPCTALECFKIARSAPAKDLDGDETNKNETVDDTAIIYNSSTMEKLKAGVSETSYLLNEACNRAISPDPLLNDLDQDGIPDCPNFPGGQKLTKRNGMASFAEIGSSYTIAVSNVHLVRSEHLKDPREKKRKWARQLAADLEKFDDSATSYAIGGDFNTTRCENPPTQDEPVSCTGLPWWRALTTVGAIFDAPPGENQGFAYDDTIYQTHGVERGQPALSAQFNDGNLRREFRIDFIFTKSRLSSVGDEPIYASHDLTCGLTAVPPRERNCKDLRNPERYSDHRLLWTFSATSPT